MRVVYVVLKNHSGELGRERVVLHEGTDQSYTIRLAVETFLSDNILDVGDSISIEE